MVRIKRLLDLLATVVAILGTAPVLAYLDQPVLLLFLLALAGGAWCDRRERYWLSGTAATALAVVGMLIYVVQVTKADVATPMVHALVILLGVRLLVSKQGRDYLQIFVLSVFILAGSSLLDLGLGFIVYLVLLIFGVIQGLVLLTVFATDKRLALPRTDLLKLIRVTLIMPVLSLVLMLVFFVVLPRTRHPMWNFLNPAGKAVVGLSETVSPGSYAQISEVRQLAFRAEAPELGVGDLYWRAVVLNQPAGAQWVRRPPPESGSVRVRGDKPLNVTIYPEPRVDRYLVMLEQPAMVSGIRHYRASDHVYQTLVAIDQRYRYEIKAQLGAALVLSEMPDRGFYLTLPEQISPRVRDAAAGIAAQQGGAAAKLEALERFFLEQGLEYAMADLAGGADPIDDFLFGKKRGYCEFFASSYAVLARLAGIPTRLVGGYYGGNYNRLGGYYTVFEEMAHVWVEVLLDDNRWVRIDPSQWAANAGTAIRGRAAGPGAWQNLVDAMDYYWVQAVVIFDFYRQIAVFRQARESLRGLRTGRIELDPVLLGVPLSFFALFGLWRWLRRPDRQAQLLQEYRARVRRRHGKELAAESLGLTELAERLDDDRCREFARIYQGAIFRDRPLSRVETERLKQLIREL